MGSYQLQVRTHFMAFAGSRAYLHLSRAEDLRRSVDNCIAALRGTKKIDLFEPARIDREVPVEDAVRYLAELVKEGKFDHIGLSECRADTLRRGHSVRPFFMVQITHYT